MSINLNPTLLRSNPNPPQSTHHYPKICLATCYHWPCLQWWQRWDPQIDNHIRGWSLFPPKVSMCIVCMPRSISSPWWQMWDQLDSCLQPGLQLPYRLFLAGLRSQCKLGLMWDVPFRKTNHDGVAKQQQLGINSGESQASPVCFVGPFKHFVWSGPDSCTGHLGQSPGPEILGGPKSKGIQQIIFKIFSKKEKKKIIIKNKIISTLSRLIWVPFDDQGRLGPI